MTAQWKCVADLIRSPFLQGEGISSFVSTDTARQEQLEEADLRAPGGCRLWHTDVFAPPQATPDHVNRNLHAEPEARNCTL